MSRNHWDCCGLFLKLGEFVNDLGYALLEVFDQLAVVFLGITGLSVADAGNEFVVYTEKVNDELLGLVLVRAGNQLLIYEALGENITNYITDVSLEVSATCHSGVF